MAIAANAEITVNLDDMGKQVLARLAAVGPLVDAAINHVRFPTPDSMTALEGVVNTYLRVVDDDGDD